MMSYCRASSAHSRSRLLAKLKAVFWCKCAGVGPVPALVASLLCAVVPLSSCGKATSRGQLSPERATETGSGKPGLLRGRVVDLNGTPVAKARVETGQGVVLTDANGRFESGLVKGPQWVTVRKPGYVTRSRVGVPERPLLVRLTDDPQGDTLTLAFAGDTMFARRMYDPNEDGDTSDAVLKPGTEKADIVALLSPLSPWMGLSDLFFVNLETPVLSDNRVYMHKAQGRDAVYHPSKAYAFASRSESLAALKASGVTLVGLANNHVYDALETGVTETLSALETSGFQLGRGSFGLGRATDEAWRPAIVSVSRRDGADAGRAPTQVAVVGCTTISGKEHLIDYVASANKGGAPMCDVTRVAKAVRAARMAADVVIFMVHGGKEYGREPTPPVTRFTDAALSAGADFVINHHPHVVSGFASPAAAEPLPGKPRQPERLVAWSLGNFVFDQTVWPTFESYVLFLQLRKGTLVRAYVEPLALERFTPKAVVGGLADFVASGAAGRAGGNYLMDDGAVELFPRAARKLVTRTVTADAHSKNGTALLTHVGEVPRSSTRLGRDLLWVGGFENEILGADASEGPLWQFEGPDKEISRRFAGEGLYGAALSRDPRDTKDIVLTHKHRFLARPGAMVTVAGRARSTSGRLSVEVSWYKDTKGGSYKREVFVAPVPADGAWHEFRYDILVPEDISAGEPGGTPSDDVETPGQVEAKPAFALYFRLPPEGSAHLAAFDGLRVVEWAPLGTKPTLEHTHSLHPAGARVTLMRACAPGGCQ